MKVETDTAPSDRPQKSWSEHPYLKAHYKVLKYLFWSIQIPPANGQVAAIQALPTDWLIFDEMTRAHRIASIRCCSVVSAVTVSIFGGCAKLPSTALQGPTEQKGKL